MTEPGTDPRIGTTLGPYRIESVIGRGGMGVVYRATDSNLDRRVALKLLSPDIAGDEAFTARFLRESKLAASLDHPNIIPVYDAGRVGDIYYLAMRYVDGADLESRLRGGPLDPRATMSLAAQIGSALDSAAEAGLVHRDVKPANILIASGKAVDREDHAYLTDFGLTKQRGSQTGLTRTGSFLGTLEYVAPEQIEGKPVDGRTDQYALAAIVVECLTGAPPFPRDSDLAIINAQLRDAPPSVHERRPDLPAAVDVVVARALAKQPDDRYPDCRSFLDELRSALGVTATQPRPAPGSSPRRGPIVVGVAVATVAVLAVVVLLASNGTFGGAAGASPSGSTAVQASAPAPSADASATLGAFPTAAEAALIAALPAELQATCARGPYRQVAAESFGSGQPLATVLCSLVAASGANS
ncbi:MAG TPA: serine/threonine-protein kinase, partial [Candidatus Limnocylindrales bacterium]